MPGQSARVGQDEIYRLTHLTKTREKGGVVFELRVPSFSVSGGELIGLVGPSGCGKSTLLDILGLVLKPSGAKEFSLGFGDNGDRLDILSLSEKRLARIRRRRIGYVLQTGGLLSFLSVRDNILLPQKINRLRGAENVALNLAQRLGIAEQLHKKPQHLSGGQRQRAAIARALALRPPVILADEPTAAVDKLTATEIWDRFKELSRRMGVTLVVVTHDVGMVRDAADRIYTFRVEKTGPESTLATVLPVRAEG